ncbi:MAG: tetratricopeptide repeat protein [Thermodesulfobacteriota bacterium]|nr:tetratricopeptide repeat protein [Thermodesulfobacteriota bacterium]
MAGVMACSPAVINDKGAAPATTAELSSVPGNAYYYFTKSEISRQEGDLDNTIYWLNRAIHADPDSAYLKKELAFIFIYQEDYPKALGLVNQILDDQPDNVDAMVMRGGIYHRMGENDKAAAAYEQVIAKDPSLEKIYLILGSIYMETNAPRRAANVYKKITTRFPDLWDGYFFLAKAHKEMGNFSAAEENFQKCLELDSQLLSPRFELISLYKKWNTGDIKSRTVKPGDTLSGLCREVYGRYDDKIAENVLAANPEISDMNALKAGQTIVFPAVETAAPPPTVRDDKIISLYQSILDDYPDNYKAAIGLSLFYHKTGEQKKARDLMKSLGEKSRSDIGVVRALFQVLIDRQQYDEARTVVTGMLKGAPDAAGLHYMMGVILDKAKEKQKALHHFEKVAEGTRYYENALVHMAFLYEETGATRQAETTFRQLIQDNPDNPKFHLYLGSLYEREEAYEKAKQLFKQGLEIDPGNIDLMFRLGVVYDKTGRKQAVIQQMKDLLEKDPDNASALNYLGFTYAELGEKLDKARSLIEKALRLKPDDPYITDSLGWVYFKKGDLVKALEMLKKAVNLEPNDPVLLEHLGDAYQKHGDSEKALEMYRRSLENTGNGVNESDPAEIKSKIDRILKSTEH